MRRLFITGAAGNLGSAVASALLADRHEVHAAEPAVKAASGSYLSQLADHRGDTQCPQP